jgi:hypothetical protein
MESLLWTESLILLHPLLLLTFNLLRALPTFLESMLLHSVLFLLCAPAVVVTLLLLTSLLLLALLLIFLLLLGGLLPILLLLAHPYVPIVFFVAVEGS